MRWISLGVVAVALLVPGTASGAVTVVADHLNNPRQLELAPDGSVYVAEAGRGGSKCLASDFGPTCVGYTSSVTRVTAAGRRSRVATGIASVSGPDGSFATGLDSVTRSPTDVFYGPVANAVVSSGFPPGAAGMLGRLLRLPFFSRPVGVANVSAFEQANNPDGGPIDSNPYGVLARPEGVYVADAGANAILRVNGNKVTLAAVMPATANGADSVPTSLAAGPDGSVYVAELTGDAAGPNQARVFRLPPGGGAPVVVASGLRSMTGIDVDSAGNIYVAEFQLNAGGQDPAGDIVKIAPSGQRTQLGLGSVFLPGGVAVAPNGDLYVSNWSVLPESTPPDGGFGGANGQLVKITQDANGGPTASRTLEVKVRRAPGL